MQLFTYIESYTSFLTHAIIFCLLSFVTVLFYIFYVFFPSLKKKYLLSWNFLYSAYVDKQMKIQCYSWKLNRHLLSRVQ